MTFKSTLLLNSAPAEKSKRGLLDREMAEEILYQEQIVKSAGSFKEGSWKYWLLAATVLALPVNNALFDPAPNGPVS
jgi:hypothetical protein